MANPITAQLEAARAEAEDLRKKLERAKIDYEVAKARADAFEIAATAFDDQGDPAYRSGARKESG
jgi:hypothetical protein